MTEADLCASLAVKLGQILSLSQVQSSSEQRYFPPGSLTIAQPLEEQQGEDEKPLVHIFNGYVPASTEMPQKVPFVSVLPSKLTVSQEDVLFAVNLDICAFGPEETQGRYGQIDVLNLIHRIYAGLQTLPDRVLSERYLLTGELETVFDPEDYRPYQHAVMTTLWQYKAPFSLTSNLDLPDYE